jgi:DNA polymerase IV
MSEAQKLCPHAVFLPGRMARYAEVSRQIFAVFRRFTPEVEPLSLDEAFLDVTRSMSLFGAPLDLARRLRAEIRADAGLAVSVGIAPAKMVAKIASTLAKPDGLLEVKNADVVSFLAPLAVNHLWGVGPVTHRALERAGIRTIGDLALADVRALRAAVGRQAEALQAMAVGDDPRTVEADRERKSYGEENTFAKDMTDGPEVVATIVAHAEAVAARLRADERVARTVVLKVKLAERIGPGKYPLVNRNHTLAAATNDGRVISRAAVGLWRAIATGKRIRLIGVSTTNIEEVRSDQLSLLEPRLGDGDGALGRALDEISARFGREAIRRGGAIVDRAAPTLAIKDRRSKD